MKSMLLTAVSAACLLLCAENAFADDQPTVLAKAGVGYDAREADSDRCDTIIQRAPNSDLPPDEHPMGGVTVIGPSVAASAAGGMMAAAMIESMELARGRAAASKVCMRNLGYVELPLTPSEATAYGRGSHEAWERTFLATDLSARIKAMNLPIVPQLPPYRDEPMSHGGLKIDAASLALAGPTNDGEGTILTGKAVRIRTATLVTPIATTDGDIRISAAPGTVFHQIDNRTQREPLLRKLSATWCGPVKQSANGVDADDFFCFTGRDDGYEIYRPSGQSWYAGPYKDGLKLPRYTQPIKLEERASDDLGPLDLTVEVTDTHIHWIDLAAYVSRDGKKSEIWSRHLVFNSKGEATLPLWNQRLLIARAGEHGSRVKLTLTQDGTGESWRDEDHDPAANP